MLWVLFGARFGFPIYDVTGCSLYLAGIVLFLTATLSTIGEALGFSTMGGLSLIYGLVLVALGPSILEREMELKAERKKKNARAVLSFWHSTVGEMRIGRIQ